MKYKCIQDYSFNTQKVMSAGDIIVLDDNNLYNVSTGRDFRDVTDYKEHIRKCLEVFTDDTVPKPVKILTDVDRFEDITDKMINIFRKKNHDYGNSFEQSLNEEGLAAARIRMGDKWNRFKQLSRGKEALVKDESLRDTLLDMANYSIMTIMWMDKNMRNGDTQSM